MSKVFNSFALNSSNESSRTTFCNGDTCGNLRHHGFRSRFSTACTSRHCCNLSIPIHHHECICAYTRDYSSSWTELAVQPNDFSALSSRVLALPASHDCIRSSGVCENNTSQARAFYTCYRDSSRHSWIQLSFGISSVILQASLSDTSGSASVARFGRRYCALDCDRAAIAEFRYSQAAKRSYG